jgi:hypothetical protein
LELLIFSFPQHSRPNFTRKRDTRSERLEIPINVVLPQVGIITEGCNLPVLARITLVFQKSSKTLQKNEESGLQALIVLVVLDCVARGRHIASLSLGFLWP